MGSESQPTESTEPTESAPPVDSTGPTGPADAPAADLRPVRLPPAAWLRVLGHTVRGFVKDSCLDLAAALTYWSLLGLFPAGIVVVALTRLVATSEQAIDTITGIVTQLAPDEAATALEHQLRAMIGERAAAQVLLSFGLLGAVWTASAYLRSFTRAANRIYRVPEGRPVYLLIPQQLGLTLVMLVLVAMVVVGLTVSGPVAAAIGEALGVADTALQVWRVAKWPVLVLIAALLLSLLFWAAPNVRHPRFRWLPLGGVLALVVWVVVSVGFAFYVANFGSYDATYGTLGAVIVFLVWLFLANSAILLGVEFNAALQRRRRIARGERVDPDAPPLPPKRPARSQRPMRSRLPRWTRRWTTRRWTRRRVKK